jgi:hypothetical protein
MNKLKELFYITYWTKFDYNKMDICEKNDLNWINFVSRTSQNNWVVWKVKVFENKKPLKKWQITVSLWWSYVLSSFLQLEDFYTGQNIAVLNPIEKLSERELFYYCMCITKNRFRYWAFWREANSSLKDLLIPSKNEIPNFVYESKIPDYSDIKDNLINEKINLNLSKFKFFIMEDLFDIKWTKTTKKEILMESWFWNYPYITTQSSNNWVYGFYNIFTEKWWVLTIDSAVTWFCSFQEKDFSASDHVEKLTPKFKINKYIWLFFTSLINKEQYRYNYWRKFNQERIKQTKIKLPVDSSWKPDFVFMEKYIKSLPYSKYL